VTTAKVADDAVTGPKMATAVFTRAAAQSITNSGAAVTVDWDTEVSDPDSVASESAGLITIAKAGSYVITAVLDYASAPTGGSLQVRKPTASDQNIGGQVGTKAGDTSILTVGAVHYFAASDTFAVVTSHSSGGAINVTGELQITRVGA
jgi:Fe-S cluster assembly iron-binding protein IscA